jgi:uncharacterized protein YciI
MAQAALQLMTTAFELLPASLREAHAAFLCERRDALVTFGPIRHADGTPAGYAYQTDYRGTSVEPMLVFLRDDPLTKAGVVHGSIARGWRCALKHRQPAMPERPGLRGFFFFGIGKPNITAKRNSIVEAHRAHLMQVDESNCLSRGFLTDTGATEWLGSAMVYEFADRAALEEVFAAEPYCTHGIYERIVVFDWQRGTMAD